MADSIDLRRGVDLNVIANKQKHQHRFILVANFFVDTKVLASMAEAKLAYQAARAKAEEAGIDPGEVTQPDVQLPMTKDTLLGVDGPGCLKCGIHWESEDGWGALCPVSDDVFKEQGEPVRTPQPAGPVPQQPVPQEPSLQVVR